MTRSHDAGTLPAQPATLAPWEEVVGTLTAVTATHPSTILDINDTQINLAGSLPENLDAHTGDLVGVLRTDHDYRLIHPDD